MREGWEKKVESSNSERSEPSTLNPSLVPKPGYYLRGTILVLLRPFITICQWHVSFPLPTSPSQVPLPGSHEKPPEIGILNRSKSSLSAEESPADHRRIFHSSVWCEEKEKGWRIGYIVACYSTRKFNADLFIRSFIRGPKRFLARFVHDLKIKIGDYNSIFSGNSISTIWLRCSLIGSTNSIQCNRSKIL